MTLLGMLLKPNCCAFECVWRMLSPPKVERHGNRFDSRVHGTRGAIQKGWPTAREDVCCGWHQMDACEEIEQKFHCSLSDSIAVVFIWLYASASSSSSSIWSVCKDVV